MRSAVVDLGSNSVRLVVFEGLGRNPVAIFNEKAVLRLGRGLQSTGRLNAEGMAQALPVLARYHAVATAMGASPFEVLATAAVRDATNGPEFVARAEAVMPGISVRVLSGREEAALSAEGLLCGVPDADGVLADIGGGSLELVRLEGGATGVGVTLRLGVIRLSDRAGGEVARAREIAEADLAEVDWLGNARGRTLYLVGGAWRALARVHMVRTGYPLVIVNRYALAAGAAMALADEVAGLRGKALEKLAGVPRRRAEDLPYAAVVLRHLLRGSRAREVVFSANGLREGWFLRLVSPATRAADPVLAAAMDLARQFGRDAALPPLLVRWTAPALAPELPEASRLREAACWMSDTGSHDHPEYRAEQSFLRVLRLPCVALDHPSRAFLALAVALRYEADPAAAFLAPARALLDPASALRAEQLGAALRLAYTLCAGTPALLRQAWLVGAGGRIELHLAPGAGVFAGEGVTRRLERLGQALGMPASVQVG